MKQLFYISCLSILFLSCRQCDVCQQVEPFVNFYMEATDTLMHPIKDNDQMKVYVYQKNRNWDTSQIFDSSGIIHLNWYRGNVNHAGDTFSWMFVIDRNITPFRRVEDLGNYDFWLKSTKSNMQIKLSNMRVNIHDESGRCACDKSSFEQCTINDSNNQYNKPVYLW